MNEQWDFPVKKRENGELQTVDVIAVAVQDPVRTPMTWAAFSLAEMCQALEDGATPDALFTEHFKETELALAESVDRRIAMRLQIKADLEISRTQRADWDRRVQQLKALDDLCDEKTIETMQRHPDLPYKGQMGRFALQKNPPSLKLAFGEKGITSDMLTFFAIPPEFVKTTIEINTVAVKDALKAGKEIPWAELKADGCHLRVRKS